MEYSRELVGRYKKVMPEDYNHLVTDEQAQSDLDSLARLFSIFTKIEKREQNTD